MNKLKNNTGIDINHLLVCIEKEKEWLYVYQVVQWFQDTIYLYTQQYGKDSYFVSRFITCMKENKYCRMWALRRILFEWGLDGCYKDIRRDIKNRTQSKLLISNLLNKLDSLWLIPTERGTKNIYTFIHTA